MNNEEFIRPSEQEAFETTKWIRKSMKKRYKKKGNKNQNDGNEEFEPSFDIYYRYVYYLCI